MRSHLIASLTVPCIVAACVAPYADDDATSTTDALSRDSLAAPPETTAIDAFAGDFDGDGKADTARWVGGGDRWDVTTSCGGDFLPRAWTGGAWGSDGPIHVGDFNGDKKSDLMMWRASSHDWTLAVSNGHDFVTQGWQGAWGSDGPNFVGDLNGDGKSDVFMWRPSNNDWTVNVSTGSGFRAMSWSGAWGSDGPIHVGDLNGDGKTDVFMWRGGSNDWTVNLSTGTGWNAQIWQGAWGSDGEIHVGDLNGDGKTDVFMFRAADNTWSVNLSTGSGFAAQTWYGDWGTDGPINVGDLNGDGKSDVFMWRDAGKDWTVNLSTGTGFAPAIWHGAWGSDGPIHVADVNGDRKADVLMHRWDDTWSVNLSTGSDFSSASWASSPTPVPTIKSLAATSGPLKPNAEWSLAYDVTFPRGCTPQASWATTDGKTGHAITGYVPFTPDASGKGVLASGGGFPSPLNVLLSFSCKPQSTCSGASTGATGTVSFALPPTPKVTSFTAAPDNGYTCIGQKQTFAWSVSFPSSGCGTHQVSMTATDDAHPGAPFFTAEHLADSGHLDHVANVNAHYTVTATCAGDGQSDAKTVTSNIAPASYCADAGPPKDAGAGTTFCFRAIGKASKICFTDAIYEDTKAHAQRDFDAQFPPSQYDTTSIDCSTVTTACMNPVVAPPDEE